jgi:hypothetical protein
MSQFRNWTEYGGSSMVRGGCVIRDTATQGPTGM